MMKSCEGSLGTILLMIFFATGALICFIVILALLFPDSFLDSVWRLKPDARLQFLQIGRGFSIALMMTVGGACAASAIGLAKKTEWGRTLALAVLCINLVGDSANALLWHNPKTLVGIPLAVVMIWYLLRSRAAT